MGQPVSVTRKPTSSPDLVRFETNRSFTGMGHERYRSVEDIKGDRPPDEIARLLFTHGGVKAVHLYSNIITVEIEPGTNADELEALIRELYIHYRPGVLPSIT